MNSPVPSGKSGSLPFLLRRWYNSSFSSKISAPICSKSFHTVFSRTLCTIQLDMPIISTLSLREYSAFLQHWHSREATCFARALFTFSQAWISDSSPLKLAFKFIISSVNLHIVLLVCFWILRNKSIIWHLVKELKVYSV